MKCLLVSESKGSAARKAASCLDSYLLRVGRRTWKGHLSAEGLEDLRKALRKKASRATAVSCHILRSGKSDRLAWIIGNQRLFSHNGQFPVSTSKRRQKAVDIGGMGPALSAAVKLAALFHDLGKATSGFQQDVLLKAGLGQDVPIQPIRHELVSMILLSGMVRESGAASDREFLRAISDHKRLFAYVEGAWRYLAEQKQILLHASASHYPDLDRWMPPESLPFMRSVSWLVVSHHRLPHGHFDSAPDNRCKVTSRANEHLHHYAMDGIDRFLAPAAVKSSLWEVNQGWNTAVANAASLSSKLLETDDFDIIKNETDNDAWRAAVHIYGRLSLIIGDHEASKRKVASATGANLKHLVKLTHFANTEIVAKAPPEFDSSEVGAESRRARGNSIQKKEPVDYTFGDTLQTHTHKVSRAALLTLHSLPTLQGSLPALHELPDPVSRRAPAGSMFSWQDEAADLARSTVSMHSDAGGLCFLMAGTGTGKTLAAPKIMAAMTSGGFRLNTMLGLKALTLQTGDEYRDKAGFRPGQAETIIGSTIDRLLHSMDGEEQAGPSIPGTDAVDPSISGHGLGWEDDTCLPGIIERITTSSDGRVDHEMRKFLATPVLVATLDHLMPAVDARRGGFTVAALRLGTADLVIDEIDAYDLEAQVAICRAIYLAAAFGRKVIVSSATMSSPLVHAVYEAYTAGRHVYAGMTGHSKGAVVLWCSEFASRAIHASDGASKDFVRSHQSFVALMLRELSAQPVRRQLHRSTACPDNPTANAFYASALNGCLELHKLNCNIDPKTGRKISVGIVRWNNVHDCRQFAATALEATIPGIQQRVVCYHANFATSVRHKIERNISIMLSRKPGEDGSDPLLDSPHVRTALNDNSEDDVMIVVSTSPIVETGRDFDVDWAVAEPCSTHSIIQLAGRVRRHRTGRTPGANLMLIDRPIAVATGRKSAIENPGVETQVILGDREENIWTSTMFFLDTEDRTARQMFDTAAFNERLDASCVIGMPDDKSKAAMIEYEKAAYIVEGCQPSPFSCDPLRYRAHQLSVSGFTTSGDSMSHNLHPRLRQFRRKTEKTAVFISFDDNWFCQTTASSPLSSANERVTTDWSASRYAESKCLFPGCYYDIEAASKDIEKNVDARRKCWHNELRSVAIGYHSNDPVAFYSPILGFSRSRIS